VKIVNGSKSLKEGIRTKKQLFDYLAKFGVDGEKELGKGIKVEYEHTNDTNKATRIAMDHLVEFPRYYIHLDVMEKTLEAEKETGEKCHSCCGYDIKNEEK
jgi:hypothetical protein